MQLEYMNEDELNERNLLELMRNLSEEEENEPILRSTSNQNQNENENADMEKNRREYRDYMLKM
jgi:hypothetical protein